MRKGILFAATLAVLAAPAFAQTPMPDADRTLGNGNVESAAPRVQDPIAVLGTIRTAPMLGASDRSLGNGNVESAAPRIGDPISTSSTRTLRSPGEGGVDRTLGNGNVDSDPRAGMPIR